MNRKQTGIVLSSLLAACTAVASTWNQDVPVGAKWSDAGNWDAGVPGSSDLALFQKTQANTYDVDVDTAGTTRLLQVMQPHTFNGAGSIHITRTVTENSQPIMYNTTAGTVTYNVPVRVNVSTSMPEPIYGAIEHSSGSGRTVFNGSFTLEEGSATGVNLTGTGGTFEFNGDLTVNDTLRLGVGKTVIGGSGTTSIDGPGYLLTAGSGTELHLNRTGAYTLADNVNGYLRLAKTKVVFNAAQACGTGTNVKLYQTEDASMMVSGGNYNQDFGWLAVYGSSTATDIDMADSACMWTFADSSGIAWGANQLTIANVDTNRTGIRFAIDSANGGTGLTSSQITHTTVNGTALTTEDVTVQDGYLYINQPKKNIKLVILH
jgi:hypothetical protein